NLPYDQLINRATNTFLPADALAARFEAAGIDRAKPVVASCGSGVSACVLALGLHLLGHRHVAIYDGSWSELGLPRAPPGRARPELSGRRGPPARSPTSSPISR